MRVENDLQIGNNIYKYNPDINEPKPFDSNNTDFLNLEGIEKSNLQIKDQTNLVSNYDNKEISDNINIPEPIQEENNYSNNNDDNFNPNGSLVSKLSIPKTGISTREIINPIKKEELPTKNTEQLRQIDIILNKKYKYNQEKIDIMNGFVSNSTIKVQKLIFVVGGVVMDSNVFHGVFHKSM